MNVWNCIINKDGKLISTPSSATEVTASRSVALGYFDGIHMGHQKICSTMIEQAHKYGIRAAVQTFENPPSSKSQKNLITTYPERCTLVSHMGIDDLFALPFNDRVRGMSPETFMEVCLKGWMGARVVVVGRDYRFGRDRQGDVKMLQNCSQRVWFGAISASADSSTWTGVRPSSGIHAVPSAGAGFVVTAAAASFFLPNIGTSYCVRIFGSRKEYRISATRLPTMMIIVEKMTELCSSGMSLWEMALTIS